MKNMLRTFSLLTLLAPTLALAADASKTTPSLNVPGVLTASGVKFASHCSDAAFAEAPDPVARANRCERLLVAWRAEARRAVAPADMSKPEFLSLRGLPRYPSM